MLEQMIQVKKQSAAKLKILDHLGKGKINKDCCTVNMVITTMFKDQKLLFDHYLDLDKYLKVVD